MSFEQMKSNLTWFFTMSLFWYKHIVWAHCDGVCVEGVTLVPFISSSFRNEEKAEEEKNVICSCDSINHTTPAVIFILAENTIVGALAV